MAQNSIRYNWKRSEVDEKLRQIMSAIYDASADAAKEYELSGVGGDLVLAAVPHLQEEVQLLLAGHPVGVIDIAVRAGEGPLQLEALRGG